MNVHSAATEVKIPLILILTIKSSTCSLGTVGIGTVEEYYYIEPYYLLSYSSEDSFDSSHYWQNNSKQ